MKSDNADKIKTAFTMQAEHFEEHMGSFKSTEYIDYVISELKPKRCDNVLEAAAGTGICARRLAHFVKNVTCVDLTPAMLSVAKKKAEKEKLDNISFVLGDINELPFLDKSFDIVLSRLAFHHFCDTGRAFSQMARVLKKGGKFAFIDMVADDKKQRSTRDNIEKMRDLSHVKNLSREEALELFYDNHITVDKINTIGIKKRLDDWLDFTNTSHKAKEQITALFKDDLDGKGKTGFNPFTENGKIYFNQNWLMIIGTKK